MASKQPPAFLKTQTKRGLFIRTPPAIFPPIFGLLLLGLGWRAASFEVGFPSGLAEALLGALSLLFAFALIAYLWKFFRRPAALREDLHVLPGVEGLATANLGLMTLVAVLAPYAPQLGLVLLVATTILQVALAISVLVRWSKTKDRFWQITPVWHLVFSGFLMLAPACLSLGAVDLAWGLFIGVMPIAAAIYAVSIVQFVKRVPPLPLRPMLAIHVMPLAVYGIMGAALGQGHLALIATGLAVALTIVLIVGANWLLKAGFSPFWGAFTYPLAMLASALFAIEMAVPAIIVLTIASAIGAVIAKRILQDWAKGGLAIKTNASMV